MKLFDYFRSSASYRIRIAMHIKGVDFSTHAINLVKADQQTDRYKQVNPSGLVPALKTTEGNITQSIAILDYLEHKYPTPALLPKSPYQRAQVLSFVCDIACDIHPLNNLRVLNYMKEHNHQSDKTKMIWYFHWLEQGFQTLEKKLEQTSDHRTCFAGQLTWADLCLIPQVYNAYRFKLPMQAYPFIRSIYEACNGLEAFQKAHPDQLVTTW